MTKGVIIFALGNSYWGELAQNLALSIKHTSPNMNITLLTGEGGGYHITKPHLFHKIERIHEKCYTAGGRVQYVKAKTHALELSPYQHTVMLDADMVWLPKRPIDELFFDVDFTMANRSFCQLDEPMNPGFGVWVEPQTVKDAYGFKKGKFYNLSSEFVMFKKTKEVRKMFKDAQKIFEKPKVDPLMMFQMGMPDELPFSISMIMNNVYPHRDNFLPFYWEAAERKQLDPRTMHASYYAYSMGGAMSSTGMADFYNNLVKYYHSLVGERFFPQWRDKKRVIKERQNV